VNLGGGTASCVAGAKVQGNYDRNLSWEDMHDMNNAGVRFENDNFLVDGVRVDNVEDGIRPVGKNFTIRQSWLSYIRDDCVEDDNARGGLIEDSLFDGCYVVLAERPTPPMIASGTDGRSETVVMRNNLLRLEPQPKLSHGDTSNFRAATSSSGPTCPQARPPRQHLHGGEARTGRQGFDDPAEDSDQLLQQHHGVARPGRLPGAAAELLHDHQGP
jgi:hypothetical protein